MKIIIPLAGKGTRLRPHTFTKPKPLLNVAGKPILKHILDNLMGLEFSEVIFITGPMRDKVEDFVSNNYSFKVSYIEQKVAMGTANAIQLAQEAVGDEDVLIVYSDTIFEADMSAISRAQKDPRIDGLMWVKEVEDYQRFGVVVTDKDGMMTRMVEKPKEPISKLANIGVYYVKNTRLMYEGIRYLCVPDRLKKGECYLTEAFQYMIDNGARIRIAPVLGWYDCGTFDILLETNQILLKRYGLQKSVSKNSVIIEPVFISDDVTIENSIIGPYVSIARGSHIKDSIVKNSIVDDNARLVNVEITNSTVGENTIVTGAFKKLNIGDSSEVHYN